MDPRAAHLDFRSRRWSREMEGVALSDGSIVSTGVNKVRAASFPQIAVTLY